MPIIQFTLDDFRGEKIKESAAMFRNYGACKKFSLVEIKSVLSGMISKRLVLKSIGRKNYLSLPVKEKSIPEKTGIDKSFIPHRSKYDDELYLYNQLREVRKKASERFMQSGYLVCPDNVLKEVARLKPKNKSELISINGFNTRMFNKLGNELLEIINSHSLKMPAKPFAKDKISLPQNILETKKLIDRKYTLREISDTLKLSEAVVSMQVETIVEFEPETDVSVLINKEIFDRIIEEAEKGFTNLKELKEKLPSKISYAEIRIAIAKFKASSRMNLSALQHKQ